MSGTTVLEWLVRTLLGGGCVLLVAGLAMGRLAAPARRQRLGEWAMAAALLLAPLSLAPAWLVVELPPQIAATDKSPSTHASLPTADPPEAPVAQVVEPAPVVPWAFAAAEPEGINIIDQPDAPLPPARPESPVRLAAAGPVADEAGLLHRWLQAGLLLYFAGAALLLLRWLLGHVVLWRLLRRTERVPSAIARVFDSMTRDCQRPRLVLSRRAGVPFSCGLLWPTIVVPARLAQEAPPRLLRWIFAHELMHLRRSDSRASLLFGLGQILYYPLPWFWALRRQVRLCQEYIADAAAAALDSPEDYAQFLVSWASAPRVPAGVLGVGGSSSDLFRRITMLLQAPAPVEPHCPRRWSWLAAGGLFSLAVLVAGVGLAVGAAPVPIKKAQKKDDTKKEDPKKDDAKKGVSPKDATKKGDEDKKADPFEELLKDLPPGLDPEMFKHIREQMERAGHRPTLEQLKQMRDQMARMRQVVPRFGAVAPGGGWGVQRTTRLGARVEPPSSTLAEQLDLPKGRGLVLREVVPDSAAEKAGLKAHDILLELDGKEVPNQVEGLTDLMKDIKPDTAVDAVVLRKGKKEKIKGLKLPEAKAEAGFLGQFALPGNFQPPGAVANPPGFAGGGFGAWIAPGGGGRTVMTTLFRNEDRFTTRHQEGSLVITLTGKVADGKAKVHDIHVQDGGQSTKYESVDKVPQQYRDKVKNLVEMSEKSSVRIEIKSPE
jgi:beta-lactamase regulating signal transducer with metallopeptidase domain